MNHYTVLGLPMQATTSQIKTRYQQLAKQYHPDRGGDTHMMIRINEAYRVLSDPQSRYLYNLSISKSTPASPSVAAHQYRAAPRPSPTPARSRPQSAPIDFLWLRIIALSSGAVLLIILFFIGSPHDTAHSLITTAPSAQSVASTNTTVQDPTTTIPPSSAPSTTSSPHPASTTGAADTHSSHTSTEQLLQHRIALSSHQIQHQYLHIKSVIRHDVSAYVCAVQQTCYTADR